MVQRMGITPTIWPRNPTKLLPERITVASFVVLLPVGVTILAQPTEAGFCGTNG